LRASQARQSASDPSDESRTTQPDQTAGLRPSERLPAFGRSPTAPVSLAGGCAAGAGDGTNVAVGTTPVSASSEPGVAVSVGGSVGVAVGVSVAVAVGVDVAVGVSVAVGVAVAVAVAVDVLVGVSVAVFVAVDV
jgi:hypothetical protein